MPIVSKRKIVKLGDSYAVILPKGWIRFHKERLGKQKLSVKVLADSIVVVMPPDMSLDDVKKALRLFVLEKGEEVE